jgi:hypothetical protein
MEKILTLLDGKKAIILAICSAILSYLVASGTIKADLGALIQTVLSILAGGAAAYTPIALGKAYRSK